MAVDVTINLYFSVLLLGFYIVELMHTLNVLFGFVTWLQTCVCVSGVYVPQLVYIDERIILGITLSLFETGSLVHRLAALWVFLSFCLCRSIAIRDVLPFLALHGYWGLELMSSCLCEDFSC